MTKNFDSEAVDEGVEEVGSAILLNKRLQYRCFPVNFAAFSKTTSFVEHLG